MSNQISVPEFAAMLEIDKSYAYKQIKTGYIIAENGMVDTDHPQNRDFAALTLSRRGNRRMRRQVQAARKRYTKKKLTPAPRPTPEPETTGEILNVSAYAKLAGVSRQAVYDAETRGDVAFATGGGVDRDRDENREYLFAQWDKKARKMLRAGKVSGGWSFLTATPETGGGRVALIGIPPRGRDDDLLPVVSDWQEWNFDLEAGRATDPAGVTYAGLTLTHDTVTGLPGWLADDVETREGKDGGE